VQRPLKLQFLCVARAKHRSVWGRVLAPAAKLATVKARGSGFATVGTRQPCQLNPDAAKWPPAMLNPLRTAVLMGMVLLGSGHVVKAEPPGERPPHPEPRVIVNVLAVKGPHQQARVQHDARFGWKRIVRCYKANSPHRKALITLDLVVSGEGSVTRALHVRSNPDNPGLEQCLAESLPGLSMPKAPTDSTANVEMQLSPGDSMVK